MTIHAYPDGTTATHPAGLDTRPTVAQRLGDVMDRTIDQLDAAASFIPAVHNPKRDAVIDAAREVRRLSTDEIQPTPPEMWRAIGRLCAAVDAMGGAA